MTGNYESPDVIIDLSKEDIKRRYQDTAMVVFKEQQRKKDPSNYLTFGNSRRTVEYSNYGNQPVILRRPPGVSSFGSNDFTSQLLKIYQTPQQNCTIS